MQLAPHFSSFSSESVICGSGLSPVVKASKPLAPEAERWAQLLEGLRARGADYFILGCTELPIVAQSLPAEGPFVDPTEELARAAVRFCGYETVE